MNITPEVMQALAFLRKYPPVEVSVRQALNVLDNAGVFAEIDEATGYNDPEPVSKCTCPPEMFQRDGHFVGCPGDPAEWGDLA